MKIKSISGFNFAGYDSIMVSLDPNLNYYIGRNGSGKSKLGLDLPWFIMQGIAEASRDGKQPLIGERFRFIGKNGASAMGEMVLHDEVRGIDIRVIRKLTKGTTELSFNAPPGIELNQQWLNDLFNIFLIAPRKFMELSPKQQALILGIDTSQWDSQIAVLKEEATDLNRDLKKLNLLEPVEAVEKINVDALQQEKLQIKTGMNETYLKNQQLNKTTREAWEQEKKNIDEDVRIFNIDQGIINVVCNQCDDAVKVLLAHGCEVPEATTQWIELKRSTMKEKKVAADLYPPEPTYLQNMEADYIPGENEKVYVKELPDDSALVAIDQKIVEASATNEKALLYDQYLEKLQERATKEQLVIDNKAAQDKLYTERLEYIKAFKLPFDKLSVDDEGGLLLYDKPLQERYFSSGELIRIIPTLIASQKPELKYVFIQDANLLDEDNLAKIEQELTAQGFQLVFEYVGEERKVDKNCILLMNNREVQNYPENKKVHSSLNISQIPITEVEVLRIGEHNDVPGNDTAEDTMVFVVEAEEIKEH